MDKASFLKFIGNFELVRNIPGLGDDMLPLAVVSAAYDTWESSSSLKPVHDYEDVLVFLDDVEARSPRHEAYLNWMQAVLSDGSYWPIEDVLTEKAIQRGKNLIAEHRRQNVEREAKRLRRGQAARALSDPDLRRRVFERDGHRCRSCSSPELLAVDHIVAVINGGSDDFENLQTLCRSCNSSKGRKELAAWKRREREGLS